MTRYRFATPRSVSDVSRHQSRTGAPLSPHGVPYRMAHPQMAHRITPEPLPERRRIAPDLLVIAVILAVVLAASLAGVRL